MRRQRILYIMHVDWDWVKQRPHFLAQHLSRLNDVLVFYPHVSRRSNLSKNDRNGLRLHPFFRIPFSGRFPLLRNLNVILLRIIFRFFIWRHCPDVLWVTSPEFFKYVPRNISAKLVYDCMDDILAFPVNAPRRSLLEAEEKELIGASSLVFCSSNSLRGRLIARAGHVEKYVVIHNALEPSAFSSASEKTVSVKKAGAYTLGYVGTISSWLDCEALIKIVNQFASVEIHLLGPLENLEMALPSHERIKFRGPIRHGDLQAHVSCFDALLMPFQVTELTQAIDPVKLYEYVFFDKPIVSVRYPEIERFSEFVDFYVGHEELISILGRYLSEGFRKKYSDEARESFISGNTWSRRVACIEEKLFEFRNS